MINKDIQEMFLGPPRPLVVVSLSVCLSVELIDSDTLKHTFGGRSRFLILFHNMRLASKNY